jgi:hypothetical protein
MQKALLFMASLGLTLSAHAAKYAVVIGGSGEDFKRDNFFLSDFKRFDEALKKRGFEVHLAFDNAKTEGQFSAQTATKDNVLAAWKGVAAKAQKGDEVLFIIHAHGRRNEIYVAHKGHGILAQSGELETEELLPPLSDLEKVGAKALVMDFSCYSGESQQLLSDTYFARQRAKGDPDPADLISARIKRNTCIVTEASRDYVSVCSGDPQSNTFTTEILKALEGDQKLSAEDLFLVARERDNSFTNLPQISSFANPFSGFDRWLQVGDPAGLSDGQVDLEARPCEECEGQKIAKAFGEPPTKTAWEQLGAEMWERSAIVLLSQYEDAIKAQRALNQAFADKVAKVHKTLLASGEFAEFKDMSYSELNFYADMENVPALSTSSVEERTKFVESIGFFEKAQKERLMKAMDSKSAIGRFVQALHDGAKAERAARDANRARIQKLAADILQVERKAYHRNFKSEKGNPCQSFQL